MKPSKIACLYLMSSWACSQGISQHVDAPINRHLRANKLKEGNDNQAEANESAVAEDVAKSVEKERKQKKRRKKRAANGEDVVGGDERQTEGEEVSKREKREQKREKRKKKNHASDEEVAEEKEEGAVGEASVGAAVANPAEKKKEMRRKRNKEARREGKKGKGGVSMKEGKDKVLKIRTKSNVRGEGEGAPDGEEAQVVTNEAVLEKDQEDGAQNAKKQAKKETMKEAKVAVNFLKANEDGEGSTDGAGAQEVINEVTVDKVAKEDDVRNEKKQDTEVAIKENNSIIEKSPPEEVFTEATETTSDDSRQETRAEEQQEGAAHEVAKEVAMESTKNNIMNEKVQNEKKQAAKAALKEANTSIIEEPPSEEIFPGRHETNADGKEDGATDEVVSEEVPKEVVVKEGGKYYVVKDKVEQSENGATEDAIEASKTLANDSAGNDAIDEEAHIKSASQGSIEESAKPEEDNKKEPAQEVVNVIALSQSVNESVTTETSLAMENEAIVAQGPFENRMSMENEEGTNDFTNVESSGIAAGNVPAIPIYGSEQELKVDKASSFAQFMTTENIPATAVSTPAAGAGATTTGATKAAKRTRRKHNLRSSEGDENESEISHLTSFLEASDPNPVMQGAPTAKASKSAKNRRQRRM